MNNHKEKMPVRYRRLDSGQVADSYFERSLDLIFSPGSFTVEIDHSANDVGLPIDYCAEEHYFVGNLVVTDSGTAGHKQENRVTGQMLTITSRDAKEIKVFTRTFADGVWSQWRSLAPSGMYNNISTPDELLATVRSLVDESTRAKEVEDDVKRTAVDISSLVCTAGNDNVTITANSMNGEVLHSVEIPVVTTEKAGVMSAEDKEKLDENDAVLSNVVTSTVNNYSHSMEWKLTYNNNRNTTNYIASVQKNDDGSVTLTPSAGGVNMPIAIYIGTPEDGEQIDIEMTSLNKVQFPKIVYGATSTNAGTPIAELMDANGIWSASIKADGKPLYLQLMVMWSAYPHMPATIGSCSIKSVNVEFVEDFVTREDLITENLAIVPKAYKSYNPGNGALEISATWFGTGMIRVKEGMILHSDTPDNYYVIKFDSQKGYIGYERPKAEFLYYGYFIIPAGTEYIAITTSANFKNILLHKIDISLNSIIPLEYDTNRISTRKKVSKFLRKNGNIISFTENGRTIIEVFHDVDNIGELNNNFYQQSKNWREIACTDIVSGINFHPMKDKTFYSIGDSHRWKWLNKLAEITGATSGGDIFSAALAANEKFYVSRTVAMAKYIVDLYKAGKPVDYIFLEYVHKYFTNDLSPSNLYSYSGDITQAEPFLTQAYYDYTARTFSNTTEALTFWNENQRSIVSQFNPVSNAIIALKTGVKVQVPKFKLLGNSTSAGNFTIRFTDHNGKVFQMTMVVPAGLTINEALTLINEIEFVDSGCKWDNLNAHNTITDASIKFTYVGDLNDSDAGIKLSFDPGTTGITYDGDWGIVTETKDWIRGFKSHDVSEWNDTDKWHDLNANMDAYIWIKAAVELLQREIPTAKIFVWTLCTESWNYANNTIEGNSVLYPDGTLNVQAIYNSNTHKRMVQNVEGWEKVAKYYHLGFIPISEMNSISPANHKYYYASEDVHPTQEGYDMVAEILAKNVY